MKKIILFLAFVCCFGGRDGLKAQTCNVQDSLELVAFYNQCGGVNWISPYNWTLSQAVTTWQGISLNSVGRVTNISISNVNMNGASVPNFNALTGLTWLGLSSCNLSGELPNSLPLQLQYFNVEGNNIEDNTIPSYYAPSLQWLHLANNKLSGVIPTMFAPNFNALSCSNNFFNFGDLANIFNLGGNYAPQKTLLPTATLSNGTLTADLAGMANASQLTYKWYKNGDLVATINSSNMYMPTQLGIYTYSITHATITQPSFLMSKNLVLTNTQGIAFTPCNIVTNTNDSGIGSLREAINCANSHIGADTIKFNITGSEQKVITLASALPALTDAGTVIDGGTWANGMPQIKLVDATNIGLGTASGFRIQAGNTEIQGIQCAFIFVENGINKIHHNLIDVKISHGIGVYVNASNSQVYENIIKKDAAVNNVSVGIQADAQNTMIFNNTISDLQYGIGLTECKNCNVNGNTILVPQSGIGSEPIGIWLSSASNNPVSLNQTTIQNNKITRGRGILTQNISDCIISQNTLSLSKIALYGSQNITIDSCHFKRNGLGDGIYVYSGSNISIGNTLPNKFENTGYAIVVDSTTTDKVKINQQNIFICNQFKEITSIVPPIINVHNTNVISGTTLPVRANASIEIFKVITCNANNQQSKTLVGTTTTDTNGNWSILSSNFQTTLNIGDKITALVTPNFNTGVAQGRNTSSFAAYKTIIPPCPTITTIPSTNITICAGTQSVTLSVAPVTGSLYVWSGPNSFTYSGSASSVTLTGTATPAMSGLYSVTVYDSNNCVTHTGTVNVIVNPKPSVGQPFGGEPVQSCVGKTVELNFVNTGNVTGGTPPYTYTWQQVSTGIMLPNPYNISSLAASHVGSYVLSVTDSKGCTATSNTNIEMYQNPAIYALANAGTSCQSTTSSGVSVALNNSEIGVNYFLFSDTTSAFMQGTGNPISFPAQNKAGVYKVYAFKPYGNGNNCIKTMQDSVTINAAPTVSITNNPTNLTANIGNSNVQSYLWSNNATTASISKTNLIGGTYSVTVTSVNGCTASSSISFCPAPNVHTSTVTICGGTPFFISAGTTGANYTWINPHGYVMPNSNANSITISGIAPAIPGLYKAIVSDINGCVTDTGKVIVTIHALPRQYWAEPNTSNTYCSTSNNFIFTTDGSEIGVNYTVEKDGQLLITPFTTIHTTTAGTGNSLSFGPFTEAGTYRIYAYNPTTQCQGIYLGGGSTGGGFTTFTPSPTVTTTQVGNTLTASATGGSGNYTYAWSNGANTASTTATIAGTYIVTVTDTNGCSTSSSIVSCNSNVTISHANTPNSTLFTFVAQAPVGANYTYEWFYQGNSIGVGSNISYNFNACGTFTVDLKINVGNGCALQTISKTITLNSSISSISITKTPNTPICQGIPVNLTASGLGSGQITAFAWSDGSNGNNTTITNTTAVGLVLYSLTITDNVGCTKTALTAVTYLAKPTATISAVNSPLCFGEATGSANVSVTGGTSYNYLWSNGSQISNIFNLSAGTYTVTVSGSNSCMTTATTTISEPTLLVLSTSQTNNLCAGQSNGTATVIPSGGTIGYNYLWSNGATTSTITGLVAGTYGVTVTDANGCTKATNLTITEPAALVIDINNQASNNSYTAIVNGGTAPYTYLWSNNSTSSSISNYAPAGTYTVTVTDANGCTKIKSIENCISHVGVTHAITTAPNVTFYANAPTGNNYIYNWYGTIDSPTSPVASGAQPTIPFSNAGKPITIYLVVTMPNNPCIEKDTIAYTFTIPCTLNGNINAQNIVCQNANTTISAIAIGGTAPYRYHWSTGDTTAAIPISSFALGAVVFDVTITDALDCEVYLTKIITFVPTPSLATSSTNVVCNGGNNGTAAATTVVTPPYSYTWSNGQNTSNITGLTAGTYTVTATDGNGCTGTTIVTITQPASVVTNAIPTAALCYGANGSAILSATGGNGSYTFAASGGTINGSTLTAAAGTYIITATDGNGCTGTTTVTIAQPAAVVTNAIPTAALCYAANGSAALSATGGNGSYTFTANGGTINGSTLTTAAGTYTITATDGNGCIGTTTVTITQPVTVVTNAIPTAALCNGANGSAILSATGGNGSYTFTASGGTINGTTLTATAGTYTITATDGNGCTGTTTVTITQPVTVVTNAIPTAALCNGANGSAILSATGGNGSYVFTASGGTINGSTLTAAAGTYTITATDGNGCTGTTTVTITQPAAVLTNGIPTAALCYGANGSTILSATGGNGSYTFITSGGTINGSTLTAAAGTYTITATDGNGCTGTTTVTITQPAAVLINAIPTAALCYGTNGSAILSATGGNGSYTFTASGGTINGSTLTAAAGTYTITATDGNGCTGTTIVTITQPFAPLDVIFDKNNVKCFGGSDGTVIAYGQGGTAPYNYVWSMPFVTGLNAGTYTVTVTDAKLCTKVKSVIITQPTEIILTITKTNISCTGNNDGSATVIATGGTGAYTYKWSNSINNTSNSSNNLGIGSYTVTVTDTNNCTKTAAVNITVEPLMAIQPLSYTGTLSSCSGNVNATLICTASWTGTSLLTYQWFYSPNNSSWQTASGLSTNTTYQATVRGYYRCKVSNNCGDKLSNTISASGYPVVQIPGVGVCINRAINANISNVPTSIQWQKRNCNSPTNIPWSPVCNGTSTCTPTTSGIYRVIATFEGCNSQMISNYTNCISSTPCPTTPALTMNKGDDMVFENIDFTTYQPQWADPSEILPMEGIIEEVIVTNIKPTNLVFSIYPNPTRDNLHLQYTLIEDGMAQLSITDMKGMKKLVWKENKAAGDYTETLEQVIEELPSGMYLLTLATPRESITQKMIKIK